MRLAETQATPYQPKTAIAAKLGRRLHRYQARRILRFDLDRPVVSFTFDDFPRSAALVAAPMLEAEDWRATFYVSSGLLGVTNHHGENFLAGDVQNLHGKGHEIAGHTHDHIDCVQNDIASVLENISANQAALEQMGVPAPAHFAYPFGELNAAVKRTLSSQYKTMRGVRSGAHQGRADLNDLKSAPIFSGPSLRRTLDLVADLKSKPAWLTLFTHDVRDMPSQWGCTAEDFAACVQAVKDTGALVLPIGEAYSYVKDHSYGQ